jgi:hypothetical protein
VTAFDIVLGVLALAAAPGDPEHSRTPVINAAGAEDDEAENRARLTQLGLVNFQRHAEVIRYTSSSLEFANGRATGLRQFVVQIAPAGNGRSAEVLAVSGRGPLAGPLRAGERHRQTISIEEYRSLRTQLLRLAANLTMREQDVSGSINVCSHAPSARFDMRLGGESRLELSRTAGCDENATAYRAGEFLLVAAERILGRRIEGVRTR